jgi:hypothetical protein
MFGPMKAALRKRTLLSDGSQWLSAKLVKDATGKGKLVHVL